MMLDIDKLVFDPPELGCVLYLPGLPSGGSKIYDRSPYANIGTITGATWKRLPSGLWYLSFDGTDDYVDCGDNSAFALGDSFSFSFWYNPGSTGPASRNTFISQGDNNASPSLHIWCKDNAINFRLDAGAKEIASSALTWASQWYHIAVTCVNGNANLYRDLTSLGTVASASISDINASLLLGKQIRSGFPDWCDGSIAMVHILNIGLNLGEIQTIRDKEKHLFGVW